MSAAVSTVDCKESMYAFQLQRTNNFVTPGNGSGESTKISRCNSNFSMQQK